MSPTSEKISPRSAYRLFELVDMDRVGLWSGAYGCTVVGVDAFDAFGLVRCVVLLLFKSDAFPTDI